MRNRTALRLLYVLAAAAGILPPFLFLGYAFRQSVSLVERDLEFIGTGTVVRSGSILEAIASTLRKVASITGDEASHETLATLRQAIFLNRYIQAIGLRQGNLLTCTSEKIFARPIPIDTPLPPVGQFRIGPPVSRGFAPLSVAMLYSFAPNAAIEGLADPNIFNEFFDYYAHQSQCRVFIYLDKDELITSFGDATVPAPQAVDLERINQLQWLGHTLVRVSQSDKYPIYTVTVTRTSSVTLKWIRSAAEFAAAGIVVAALLTGLILRLARRTQSLEADLREAVKYREIDVHYQPIMNLETGACIGCESLLRWRHPRRGLIPAAEFISIAEKMDLILPMTDILLRKVVDDLSVFMRQEPSLHVAVNLAPQHFASERIVTSVRDVFAGKIDPRQVIFEITERGLVAEENSPARAVMQGLTEHGAKLAVDDFGTGYSSLSYLQRFPLDYLKIDKAFVDGIENRTTSSGLVDQIIRIADSLQMDVIAEGVEQAFQAEYLAARGVRYAQGWHFGCPMPGAEFRKFVKKMNAHAAVQSA